MADTARIIDFDAFRREQNQDPVILKIGGDEVLLPPELPATVALDVLRMRQEHDKDEDVPPQEVANLGAQLFGGEEAFRSLCIKYKVGLLEMASLVQMAMRAYNEDLPSPNRKTRRKARRTTSRS